eukprot:gb/GEZN01003666.1/.p1 GENE.gb/GEZN01003666.1/~~gb/GEZN01003666.1/.p1  ORF type:complete len:597 (-),score=98.44 gb/GEZN01003666.1/:249-2039(-)
MHVCVRASDSLAAAHPSAEKSGGSQNKEPISEVDELFSAVREGNTARVQEMLENKVNVDMRNHRGETALMEASYQGQVKVVRQLLTSRADVHSRCSVYYNTPLLWAACSRIYHDAMPYSSLNGFSPGQRHERLQRVAECVALLIANGADEDAQNNGGETALMEAVRGLQWSVVDALFACGNPNLELRNEAKQDLRQLVGTEQYAIVLDRRNWVRADLSARSTARRLAFLHGLNPSKCLQPSQQSASVLSSNSSSSPSTFLTSSSSSCPSQSNSPSSSFSSSCSSSSSFSVISNRSSLSVSSPFSSSPSFLASDIIGVACTTPSSSSSSVSSSSGCDNQTTSPNLRRSKRRASAKATESVRKNKRSKELITSNNTELKRGKDTKRTEGKRRGRERKGRKKCESAPEGQVIGNSLCLSSAPLPSPCDPDTCEETLIEDKEGLLKRQGSLLGRLLGVVSELEPQDLSVSEQTSGTYSGQLQQRVKECSTHSMAMFTNENLSSPLWSVLASSDLYEPSLLKLVWELAEHPNGQLGRPQAPVVVVKGAEEGGNLPPEIAAEVDAESSDDEESEDDEAVGFDPQSNRGLEGSDEDSEEELIT